MSKVDPLKTTRALKSMEQRLNVLKLEVKLREYAGFEECIEMFKEHFSDQLRKEAEYIERLNVKED